MAQGRPYQAYQTTSVKTSSQKQLIIMLYDGMQRFNNKAIQSIHAKDFEMAHQNLNRTGKILLELLSTLREDKGGDIAANLKKIYVHCYEQIVIANLKKDIQMIMDVQKVLNNLSDGWKQMAKKGQMPKVAASPQQIRVTG